MRVQTKMNITPILDPRRLLPAPDPSRWIFEPATDDKKIVEVMDVFVPTITKDAFGTREGQQHIKLRLEVGLLKSLIAGRVGPEALNPLLSKLDPEVKAFVVATFYKHIEVVRKKIKEI